MSSIAFLQKAYLAYFGRPVDATGIAAFGPTSTATDAQVQNAFFASAESQSLYGTTFGVTQINAIYQMLFNRAAEPAGLAYWANEVARGALTPAGAAIGIMNGALNADATAVTNKLAASAAYQAAIDTTPEILAYVGDAAAGIARAFLATVTTTVPTAAAIDANIITMVAGSVGVGTTFSLTTGSDNILGTGGNDVINALSGLTAAATTDTLTAADTINGGAGIDTLNITVLGTNTDVTHGALISNVEVVTIRNTAAATTATYAAGAGVTGVTATNSVGDVTVTGLATGGSFGVNGDGATVNGASAFGYAAAATAAVLNLSNGVTAGAVTLTGTGLVSDTVNSTGAANKIGALGLAATDKAMTINAATNLTTGAVTGAALATVTLTGAGAINLSATALPATVTKIDGSANAGGVTLALGTSATQVDTFGAGNDLITTGGVLTTGSVAAGAGTGDRLTLNADADIASLALGNKYSGFEIASVGTGGVNLDLDMLATNNTLTGLRLTGNSTVTNISATVAANITETASNVSTLTVKGSTTPGQIDTVNLSVNDGAAAVANINLGAITLTGVEVLGIAATDNITNAGPAAGLTLANATALTNINISGAAATWIDTTGIALQTNFNVNASTATGNVTFNATGATANGFSFTGGAGVNTVTGGSQIFSVNLAASAAKADIVGLSNATGGTYALANATIAGFTNSATASVGDKLDVAGAVVVGKAGVAVAAAATAAVPTMTGALSTTGIMTFAGAGAAAATLTNKIDASLEAAYVGGTNLQTVAFEHNGNTYVVESDGNAGFQAGADYVIVLTGVTGVTALSTAASAATTIWVA